MATAICFWGAFSKPTSGQTGEADAAANAVAARMTSRSILRAIGGDPDIYVHSWTDWMPDALPRLRSTSIEPNSSALPHILSALARCKIDRDDQELTQALFNQISAAISRSRVLKLLDRSEKKYDRVLLIRPDLIVAGRLNPPAIPGTIYSGASPTTVWGDFYFSLHPDEIPLFHEFPAAIGSDLLPLPHYGFPNFTFRRGVHFVDDRLVAGRDIEVYRKIKIPSRQYGIPIKTFAFNKSENDFLRNLADDGESTRPMLSVIVGSYVSRFEDIHQYRSWIDHKVSFYNGIDGQDDIATLKSIFSDADAEAVMPGAIHAAYQSREDCFANRCFEEEILNKGLVPSWINDPWVAHHLVMCVEHYKMKGMASLFQLYQLHDMLTAIPTQVCSDAIRRIKFMNEMSIAQVLERDRHSFAR